MLARALKQSGASERLPQVSVAVLAPWSRSIPRLHAVLRHCYTIQYQTYRGEAPFGMAGQSQNQILSSLRSQVLPGAAAAASQSVHTGAVEAGVEGAAGKRSWLGWAAVGAHPAGIA